MKMFIRFNLLFCFLIAFAQTALAQSTCQSDEPGNYSADGSYNLTLTPSPILPYRYLELWEAAPNASWILKTSITSGPVAINVTMDGVYRYRTRWVAPSNNGSTYSSFSSECSVTVSVTAPSVAPVLASVGDLSGSAPVTVPLSWTSVDRAAWYELESADLIGSSSPAWSLIAKATGTNYNASVQTGSFWGYRVKACNIKGCSPYSQEIVVIVNIPASTTPVISAPATDADSYYDVTWTSVPGTHHYELYLSNCCGGGPSNQSLNLVYRAPGHIGTYKYKVRACKSVDASNCGPWSNTVTVIGQTPPVPSAPSFIRLMNPSVVSWASVSGANYYNLQQNRSGWVNYATNYFSTAITFGGNPVFRVQACNAGGCSAWTQM
jgi:hypothetical protein